MTHSHKLVSVTVAQAMLGGIGRTKLYALIASGALDAHKLGRRTFFKESEVTALIEALPKAMISGPNSGAQR